METPRKFIIAELSIRKLGSYGLKDLTDRKILRIESSAIISLHGVSTKLNKYIVFTMQTYKELKLNFDLFKEKSVDDYSQKEHNELV